MEAAMEIKRDSYLKQLIDYAWDGQVKVITGVRRCGKSYLLRTLYKNHLLENGVKEDHIIVIELDRRLLPENRSAARCKKAKV